MDIMPKTIIEYTKCACGAITIRFEDNATNSMSLRTKRILGIDLRKIHRQPKTQVCNYCVNHWGIDLCECGSGKKNGKCSCGSQKAMESFGTSFNSFQKILTNFGL